MMKLVKSWAVPVTFPDSCTLLRKDRAKKALLSGDVGEEDGSSEARAVSVIALRVRSMDDSLQRSSSYTLTLMCRWTKRERAVLFSIVLLKYVISTSVLI